MYTLNIARAIKEIFVNEIRYFIFENYYKRIGSSLENSYYSRKHLKRKDLLLLANNLPDSCNGKEHYQSTIAKENRKSVKQSEIITYQPKTLEKSNIFSINSII